MAKTLDEIDVRLLTELQNDADRTNVELAGVVGLSPAATLNRVRRLKDEGVIAGITAQLDPQAAGFPLQVYVLVTLGRHTEDAERRLEQAVAAMPQVISGEWIAGEHDVLLHVVTDDLERLHKVISQLSGKGGAERVITVLRLGLLKARSPLPLVASEASRARVGD